MKFILFKTGGVQLALERQRIAYVKSVDGLGIDAAVLQGHGKIHFQGRALTLIDLADILNRAAPAKHGSNANVLVTRGDPAVALWADEVKGVVDIRANQLDQLPLIFNGPERSYFSYILRRQGRLTLVLDPEALLPLSQSGASPAAQQATARQTGESTRDNPATSGQTELPGAAGQAARRHREMTHQRLEAIIVQKMQQFITQQVQCLVAQTLAEAMKPEKLKIKALLQPERPVAAAR